jgi:hypothetical protein
VLMGGALVQLNDLAPAAPHGTSHAPHSEHGMNTKVLNLDVRPSVPQIDPRSTALVGASLDQPCG